MPNCPYCGNKIDRKVEHANLSFKRRAILAYVMKGGPEGVKIQDLKKKFFFDNKSDITMRTTIHYINKEIPPNKVLRKGGIIKLIRND